MLTGYAGFRPQQLEYAVSRGINVFMEKSFAADPPGCSSGHPGVERMPRNQRCEDCGRPDVPPLRKPAGAHETNSAPGNWATFKASGPIEWEGELATARKKPEGTSDLEWQLRNFTKFFWVSGGLWAEMDIHQIDEICWLKGDYPITAHGVGGRAFNNKDHGQNLDSYSVEWTFPDGTKAYNVVRYMRKCQNEFATYVHGTKCAAKFSGNIHAGDVKLYKDQRTEDEHITWKPPREPMTPWQAQWVDFTKALREDLPFNQAERAAKSNLAAIMGRAAVHSGKTITWDEAIASEFQHNPDTDNLTFASDAPFTADANGQYPVPIPGIWTEI